MTENTEKKSDKVVDKKELDDIMDIWSGKPSAKKPTVKEPEDAPKKPKKEDTSEMDAVNEILYGKKKPKKETTDEKEPGTKKEKFVNPGI